MNEKFIHSYMYECKVTTLGSVKAKPPRDATLSNNEHLQWI